MDDNDPVVKTYHLPLTERCRNYSQIHCEWAQKCYGNTSCSGTTGNHGRREETLNFTNDGNHGRREETLNFTDDGDGNDGDGNHLEAAGMCDVFQLPSPQKTIKEQPYEIFKPQFDEFISLLEDSAAKSQIISSFTR
jgi:hypothetical protein